MPSKPLLGSPVAVGISDAVMAMRSVVSAIAEWDDSSAVSSATVQEALRMGMIYLRPTIGKSAFGIRRHEQVSGQPISAVEQKIAQLNEDVLLAAAIQARQLLFSDRKPFGLRLAQIFRRAFHLQQQFVEHHSAPRRCGPPYAAAGRNEPAPPRRENTPPPHGIRRAPRRCVRPRPASGHRADAPRPIRNRATALSDHPASRAYLPDD